MHSENVTEAILPPTAKLMTGEELVALRKHKEKEQPQPCVGVKFSSWSKTLMEKEAVECALESHSNLLSVQRGARICDLIKAEWNEELKAVVTEKLKGKFAQHMGKKADDKIVLSTEESIFLLENGCIEIMNGKVPMSTEEAYAVMLKETMSLEKYQVYSYLSQLGFIVVPHQKEPNQESSKRDKTIKSKKRKRVDAPPLSEENSHKRLTFSGALAENNSCKVSDDIPTSEELNNVNSNDIIVPSKDVEDSNVSVDVNSNDINVPSKDVEDSNVSVDDNNVTNGNDIQLSKDQEPEVSRNETRELENQVDQIEENDIIKEVQSITNPQEEETDDIIKKVQSIANPQEATSASCIEIENVEINTISESQPNETVGSTLKEIPQTCYEEMNLDSESSEMLIVAEKSAETENKSDNKQPEISIQFSDLPEISAELTVDDNEESMDVMSCSSNSAASCDDLSDDRDLRSVGMDDEITLLEVTKKETTPLAVIDLLSDDEGHSVDGDDSSGSDDEIKILKVCNGTVASDKNKSNVLLSESKIKTRKLINCKMEGRNSQNATEAVQELQFPDVFRKNQVCVARPFPNLLPLHVQVNKEVYILDLDRNSSARSESRSQSQGRLWNSFRDMQDYQRARRRNRHSNFPQSRFPPRDNRNQIHQNSQYFDDYSRNQRQTFNQINGSATRTSWTGSPRNQITDINCDSSHNSRHSDVDYRDQSLSRDMDYRTHGSLEDRKPFRTTDSSVPFAPYSPRNDPNHCIPPFTNSASVNSVISIGHTGLEFGSQPVSPLHMNTNSDNLRNREQMPGSSFLENHDFVSQVHRTAYSYATTMLSSMLGPSFNPSNLPPLMPLRGGLNPYGLNFPNCFGGPRYGSDRFSYMHRPNFGDSRINFGDRPRPVMQNPFPCMGTKRSWDDVRAAVGENDGSSSDSSDIEEIPINLNEFLWSVTNICPLVKPGVKHDKFSIYATLKKTQAANLTHKNSRNDKCFTENTSLEITFDVYLPGMNFKKSAPSTPKYRIIVTRVTSPIPKYSEMAFLQRQYNDGAVLQLAVVDAGEINFVSFKSILFPEMNNSQD